MPTQYILIMVGLIAVSFIYTKLVMGKAKSYTKDFLQQHPNASKIYVRDENSFISHFLGFGKYLNILGIGGQDGLFWDNNGKDRIYYLIPGERTLELAYQTKRPGIIHKSVMKTYKASDILVNVDENKSYQLTFDKKTESFSLDSKSA